MSRDIIPKEQMTAFQRWELTSFDPPTPPTKTTTAETKVTLPTAAEMAAQLEQARQQAYQEGFEQGQQAGQEAGYRDGYAQGEQQAQAEIVALQTLLQNLQQALDQVDADIAQSLLELALEVARKMIGISLKIKPELIVPVITEAISNLPHFNQHAHLVLHPDDASLVRQHMGEQLSQSNWRIVSDLQLERGGCRLETSSSQIDASNTARWRHIVAAIGEDSAWLD